MRQETKGSINFQDLMLHRIHEILLVASPYDAFILEEDGRLTQQILYEYLGMNLSYAPRVWHAKNAKIGLVLLPIPELGFYPLEYYLYEFKDVGENLSYNKKYWDQ